MIFLELSLKKTSRMTKSDIWGWQHLRVPKYLLDIGKRRRVEADGGKRVRSSEGEAGSSSGAQAARQAPDATTTGKARGGTNLGHPPLEHTGQDSVREGAMHYTESRPRAHQGRP